MNWQQVCIHPSLQNLPFKIELNARGQVIMSPVKVSHALYQGKIEHFLRALLKSGEAIPECAIWTPQGTKVADVAWISPQRLAIVKQEVECSIAPEICIEVLSESNTAEEMAEKRSLYLDRGAKEVWICNQQGDISCYDMNGLLEQSVLVPTFPRKIEI